MSHGSFLSIRCPFGLGNGHTPGNFHLIASASGYECPAGLWGWCGGDPEAPWRETQSQHLGLFYACEKELHNPLAYSAVHTLTWTMKWVREVPIMILSAKPPPWGRGRKLSIRNLWFPFHSIVSVPGITFPSLPCSYSQWKVSDEYHFRPSP